MRDRRGPATVTGDAERKRRRAAATGRHVRSGKARIGRARKPGDLPPTTKPETLVERGGSSPCTSSSPAWWPVSSCSSRRRRRSPRRSPSTVRIEGADRHAASKVRVTTDVRTFHFTDDAAAHQCDATARPPARYERHAACRLAAPRWSRRPSRRRSSSAAAGPTTFDSPTINSVAGENVAYDSTAQRLSRRVQERRVDERRLPAAIRSPPATACCSRTRPSASRRSALAGPASARAVAQTRDREGHRRRRRRPGRGRAVGGRATGADGTAVVGAVHAAGRAGPQGDQGRRDRARTGCACA